MPLRRFSFEIQLSTLDFAFDVIIPFYGQSVLIFCLVMKCRYGDSVPNPGQHVPIFVVLQILLQLFSIFLFEKKKAFKKSSSKRTCACPFVGVGILFGLVLLLVSSSLVKSTISIMFTYFVHEFLTYMNGLGKDLNI